MVVMAGYGVLGVVGLSGGPYVFAPPTNPDNTFDAHWLARLPARDVELATVAIAGIAMVVLWLQVRRVRLGRPILIATGAVLAAFAALILPGPLSLDSIPVLNLLNLKRLDWPTVHLVLLAYTGVAMAASTLAYARATRDACVHCGRRQGHASWPRRRWARIGLVASIAAFVAPFGYATSRLLWAAGIPVGTTAEFLARINAANPGRGTLLLELTLAAMAMGGGLLCFGLTRRWSEVWPRWVPGFAGRPVPHWFPVGMATVCGVGLAGYGAMLVPGLVRFATGAVVYFPGTTIETVWVSQIPALSLALWSPLILVSAVAFHYRTRGRCTVCHRS